MKLLTALFCALLLALPALASPGAHGPNGEHLDGPAAVSTSGSAPRVETFTELFELVGHLSGGELSILIDRYDTNEPVLNGKLEVQYQKLKAPATFHSDIGDYAVDDPAMLAALSKPGKHPLLFTFTAGEESDLIEGTLEVPQAAGHDHHDAPYRQRWALTLSVIAALTAIGAVLVRRRASQRSLK
ncbi:MAG: hypothetical protein K2X55_16455 [Burkholderiaceae bacterium]|nr:hypothetical protein [Burkholderiaceae bacterium]